MLLKGMKAKWLAVPLAALFLLFSTGAAAAPECHVASTVQPTSQSEVVHSHSAHPHSHSPQITTSAVSNSQETLFSVGSTLNNEICIVVGFIVLLLLRFSRAIRSMLTAKQFSLPRYQLPLFLSKNLGYLNLNHLQLGIIRI
jgi:hypothetical protein